MTSGWDHNASATVVVFLVALFVFASPFTDWWADIGPPWYVPYLMWLGITLATAAITRRIRRYDL